MLTIRFCTIFFLLVCICAARMVGTFWISEITHSLPDIRSYKIEKVKAFLQICFIKRSEKKARYSESLYRQWFHTPLACMYHNSYWLLCIAIHFYSPLIRPPARLQLIVMICRPTQNLLFHFVQSHFRIVQFLYISLAIGRKWRSWAYGQFDYRFVSVYICCCCCCCFRFRNFITMCVHIPSLAFN